jgi:hypothetical protein
MDVERIIEKINRKRFWEKYRKPLTIFAAIVVVLLLVEGFYFVATRW